MRGKDKKTVFFNFSPYECEAAEEYLEVMAEKGWLLQSINGSFLKFKKIEPKKLKYSVNVLHKISEFDRKDSDIAIEYRKYCQAAGWKYVCQKGKIQVFCTENYENTTPIHTDAEEKYKSVFKSSLSIVGNQIFITLLLAFQIYANLFMGSADYALATNIGIFSLITIAFIVVINTIETINFFVWSIRARANLKYNEFMPYNNMKQITTKNIFKIIYTLSFLLVLLQCLFLENQNNKILIITFVLIIIVPSATYMLLQRYINGKRYSKNTNAALYSVGFVLSVFLIIGFLGTSVLTSVIQPEQSKLPNESISLTLKDFVYNVSESGSPYIKIDKSILARRTNYIYGDLSYTVFESKYPWIIRFDEDREKSRLNKFGIHLKEDNGTLPDNIKVYTINTSKTFLIVSEDKVVDIRKDITDIEDNEFLRVVYKRLLAN